MTPFCIQSDGSLWVSKRATCVVGYPWGSHELPAELMRYGVETNWHGIAKQAMGAVLLLKTDGTLWQWGPANAGLFNGT